MRRKFKLAAEEAVPLKLIDAKSLKGAELKDIVTQASEILWQQYTYLSDGYYTPMEYFEDQLGKDGFLFVALDEKNKVCGLTAGAVYPKSKTAAFTYFVAPQKSTTGGQQLLDQTQAFLTKRKVQALFVELFKSNWEPNGAADRADRKLYKSLGAERIPIHSYQQPLAPDDNEEIPGLHPYAIFTEQNLSPAQKSDITLQHFQQFAKCYDPELSVPTNQNNLARYERELEKAHWSPKPTNRPALGIRND